MQGKRCLYLLAAFFFCVVLVAPHDARANGTVTYYGYKGDTSIVSSNGTIVDHNTYNGIAAVGKENSYSLAVSPDVAQQLNNQGISQGSWVNLQLSDGSTVTRYWNDTTASDLTGRYDIYTPYATSAGADLSVYGASAGTPTQAMLDQVAADNAAGGVRPYDATGGVGGTDTGLAGNNPNAPTDPNAATGAAGPTGPPGDVGAGSNCKCEGAKSPFYDFSTLCQTAQQNAGSYLQDQFAAAQKTMAQMPLIPANNQCFQTIMNAFNTLQTIISSFSNIGSIEKVLVTAAEQVAQQIINNLLNQVCSQIANLINTISQDITNLAKICLPLPNFNLGSFNLPTMSGCSGGMQIPLLGGSSSSITPQYNYMSFQK